MNYILKNLNIVYNMMRIKTDKNVYHERELPLIKFPDLTGMVNTKNMKFKEITNY
jgi:hypothetical protein